MAGIPNGNQVKISRLAGEKIPETDTIIFLSWNREDAVLIHNMDHSFYQKIETAAFA